VFNKELLTYLSKLSGRWGSVCTRILFSSGRKASPEVAARTGRPIGRLFHDPCTYTLRLL